MSCLALWGQAQGGIYVVKTPAPPVRRISRRESVSRDIRSVLLRGVGFGVTARSSDFRGF